MAHLLLLEVPGGNDFAVLEDAIGMGHQVTFFTGDLAQYQSQEAATQASLALARRVVEVRPFDYAALERHALAIHARAVGRSEIYQFASALAAIEAGVTAGDVGVVEYHVAGGGASEDHPRLAQGNLPPRPLRGSQDQTAKTHDFASLANTRQGAPRFQHVTHVY